MTAMVVASVVRLRSFLFVIAFASASLLTLTATPSAQQNSAETYAPTLTALGYPDGQVICSNTTSSPFERPSEFGERAFLTDEEFAEAQEEATERARNAESSSNEGSTAGPDHWYEHLGKTSNRTSHVVDPPDGKVPPLTTEAEQRPVIGTVNRERLKMPFDSWNDLSAWDRCITRGIPGSIFPTLSECFIISTAKTL